MARACSGDSQWSDTVDYATRGYLRSWSVWQIGSREALGEITGIFQLIELDKLFWRPGLVGTPRDQWLAIQEELVAKDGWIIEGDLGPYDAVEIRLHAADTIIFLDFSLVRCAWRAIRRSRERADFWLWVLAYRFKSRPFLMQAIAKHAANADLQLLRNPAAVRSFVADTARITGQLPVA